MSQYITLNIFVIIFFFFKVCFIKIELFFTLKYTNFAHTFVKLQFTSCCSCSQSSTLLIFRKHFASSANKDSNECLVQSRMSFIKSRNNNGPSMDPCGTPDVTGTNSDETPSSTCLSNNLPEKLSFCNLWINRLWSTESNAFEKSKNIISVCLPLSRCLSISS